MLQRLGTGFLNAVQDTSAWTDSLLHETTLRLAVTGLSRAGKTVFVTSLLANLLAMGRGPGAGLDTLPALRVALIPQGGAGEAVPRLRGARLVPPGHEDIPTFDLARHLAALTAPSPSWPPRTNDLTETAVELTLGRDGLLGRHRAPRRLRLEILDYPGEWLLDLPLLDQSFAAWSRETLARLRQGVRAEVFVSFLAQLPSLDPATPDHEAVRRLHQAYRDGLRVAQEEHGLRLLQPGRFLCPGPRADAPFMWFFPLEGAPDHPRSGTLADLLQGRFEAYKADMRARFFERHFARFDRQALFVDVLGALHAGRESFHDTQEALALIASCLIYGGWSLGRARHGRIERVAFAATKADHVPAIKREALRFLLRDLVEPAREPVGKGPVSFHAVASILSTQDATIDQNGLAHDVVRGTLLGSGTAKLFDPGTVPVACPPDSFWGKTHFRLPVFEPPRGEAIGAGGIPSLGLDALLLALLGDEL